MTGDGPEEKGYWRERYKELEETFALTFAAFAESLEARDGVAPSTSDAAPSQGWRDDPSLDGADHAVPSGDADGLLVSVIVPCYLSMPFLQGCIDTLTGQTLSHERFEAIFVFNGPDDGGYDHALELLAGTDLHHQVARSSRGISPARNVGATLARAPWVTLLDVDDALTPDYLKAMTDAATSPRVVPVAGIVDVDEHGNRTHSVIHEGIVAQRGVVHPLELLRPLAISTLKLLPTDITQRHPFDPSLRSGEDVALWTDLFEKEGLVFDTTPAFEGATYLRLVRDNSNGRQGMTRDFMVTQRLDVIAELSRQQTSEGELAPIRTAFINAQADFITRYVSQHPSEHDAVFDEIRARDIPGFPWERLPTDQLLVAYNFAPFNDASAVTALKRILTWGGRWNVISKDMTGQRDRDDSLTLLTRDAVARHELVEGPSAWSSWSAMEEWCERGWVALEEIEAAGLQQRRLYSRAMWPASHFLAALIKARRGSAVEWTAEFSDPLRTDAQGNRRVGSAVPSPLLSELAAALTQAGHAVPATDSLFVWAESLAYALADSLIFTNPHQLTHMLSEIDEPTLATRAADLAVIAPHPTLAARYYQLGRAPGQLDPGRRHVAYFGTFYPTRGLGDVLDGLARLTPDEAARIHLHLFTPPSDALNDALAGHPYRRSVGVYAHVPYLTFLSLAAGYDVLLVGDASTRGMGKRVNPYLPSKLSDYRGAGKPIWAHYEPGSMLSREAAPYRSRLGDPQSVAAVLSDLSSQVET